MSTPQDPNRRPPPPWGGPGRAGTPGSERRTETPWWHRPTEVIASPGLTPAQQRPPHQQPPTGSEAGTTQYPRPYGHAQPAQPGQPASAATTSGKGSKGKVVLIVAIIGVVFALIIGVALVFILTGGSGSDKTNNVVKLKVSSVQERVQQILKDPVSGYGSSDIKDVKCNNGQDPTAKKGEKFTCEVSVRGKKRQVTVTFQDDNGTYLVGLPQDGGK